MTETRAILALLALCALVVSAAEVAAEAPLGRYAITETTVRDNRTNLIWQRRVQAPPSTATEAQTYCVRLGGGFRLPTVQELRTILDVTRAAPAIDPIAFPNTPADRFWTSTLYAVVSDAPNHVWYVDFDDGGSWRQDPMLTMSVRCVR